jgi:hypothetical protein
MRGAAADVFFFIFRVFHEPVEQAYSLEHFSAAVSGGRCSS